MVVEEAALLRLRRIAHRFSAVSVHVDLEPSARKRTFEHHARRECKAILKADRYPALVEFRRGLGRTECIQRKILNLARKQDDETAQRVACREHAIDAGKGIEAPESDIRLTWQTLHWIVDVAKLEILRDEQLVFSEGAAHRETWFPAA